MLSFGNKEFRNLEEQVQKNKADIEDWKSKQETLANWGIRIVGQIESESDLPEDYSGEYGDAYQVGTGDSAKYYAWIRPTTEVAKDHWMDMGSLSIAGPQGPEGDHIEDIQNIGTTYKEETIGAVERTIATNTIKVTMSDGQSKEFTVVAKGKTGPQGIQGVQGIQGIQGEKGDKGDKGDVGPQGEMGPTVAAYHIVGIVSSTAQLPDPEILMDLSAAYIVEVSGDKALYVQIGKTMYDAKWVYLGDIAASDFWEISGSTIAPVEAVDLVQINNLDVLTSGGFTCTSPHISGVAACSAISSPLTLTLSGTTGVELLNNGKTITAPSKAGTIALTSDVETVADNLSTETTERKAQDTTLQTNIDKKANTTDLNTLKSSVDSNWSLLMANLGIGRWENATFTDWKGEVTDVDPLCTLYTNHRRCFYHRIWKQSDTTAVRSNITINCCDMVMGDKNHSYSQCYAGYTEGSDITLMLGNMAGGMSNCFVNSPAYVKIDIQEGKTVKNVGYNQGIFQSCTNLEYIGAIDFSDADQTNGGNGFMFLNCPKLKTIKITHWHGDFDISSSTAFEEADLVEIISNLDTVTTTQTLTMGATNLAKLTDAEKQVATDKGWVLA